MILLTILFSVAVLLVLILVVRLNAFLSLILVSIGTGVALGMEVSKVLASIEKGVGSTLGQLSMVLGFGAMLGEILSESGAAQKISNVLLEKLGIKNIHWALLATGFAIGIPMFFNSALVVIAPIIFSLARTTKLPVLYLAIPAVASLSITHGYLPPHPGPAAIANIYKADMSLTLLYGIIIAIPAVILSGIVVGKAMKRFDIVLPDLFQAGSVSTEKLPSFGISVFVALMPVLLMVFSGITKLLFAQNPYISAVSHFVGDPVICLLIAVLAGVWLLGIRNGRNMNEIMETLTKSVKPIAMMLLIIGAGGAFKQVLIDSGVSDAVVALIKDSAFSPLLLAWGIAALLRVCLGSATVAGITAAGIVAPMAHSGLANPELLVLVTGSGSIFFSNVNDTGFWMFKEYFNLSISQTFSSWSVMEAVASVTGLLGVLLLNMFV